MIRFAVLAESEANAKAISILTQAILGEPCDRIFGQWEAPSGFPHILQVIPAAIEELYGGTIADSLVIHADSDDGPIHGVATLFCQGKNPDCRHCEITKVVEKKLNKLRSLPERSHPRIAVAIATPSIEAWLLCGTSDGVSEEVWSNNPKTGTAGCTWRNHLKKKVYGSSRPTRAKEAQRAVEEANRLSMQIEKLERAFPQGFGAFARQLRSWNAI